MYFPKSGAHALGVALCLIFPKEVKGKSLLVWSGLTGLDTKYLGKIHILHLLRSAKVLKKQNEYRVKKIVL